MDSKEQRAVLKARLAVLTIVDRPEGSLQERLNAATNDIRVLAAAISIWVDRTAVQYRSLGYTPDEFYDDIREWFVSKQFFIDADDNDPTTLRCHLSHVGWGRHVIMSFRLHGAKMKGNPK